MLADISFSTEEVAVIAALLGAVVAPLGWISRMLITQMQQERDNYKQIANEATGNLELAALAYVKREGKGIPKALAAVVAEHSSPPTDKQEETADLATLRARTVAATLALDLEPRKSHHDKPSIEVAVDGVATASNEEVKVLIEGKIAPENTDG